MPSLKIVFAGTPAFTTPALDALLASSHQLCALYTQPDRPKGRGRVVQASPAKLWANAHNVPVYQPQNFKQAADIDALRALKPDVLVVIAYGLILPPAVLGIPRLGCINVHASLLPKYRGAAPIQYSILNGDTETGVSIMQMDAGMDTGPVYQMAHCPISETTTTGELHDTLAGLACKPLIEVLDGLASDPTIKPVAQDNSHASYAPKITTQAAEINWQTAATDIANQVRAYYPFPVARAKAGDTTFKIHQAKALPEIANAAPGTVLDITPKGLFVAAADKQLQIERIQLPGGKAIHVADYLNANKKAIYKGLVLT